MKYLYPYECETRRLSTPAELQAAIDGNRREGRRASYSPYGPDMVSPLMVSIKTTSCRKLQAYLSLFVVSSLKWFDYFSLPAFVCFLFFNKLMDNLNTDIMQFATKIFSFWNFILLLIMINERKYKLTPSYHFIITTTLHHFRNLSCETFFYKSLTQKQSFIFCFVRFLRSALSVEDLRWTEMEHQCIQQVSQTFLFSKHFCLTVAFLCIYKTNYSRLSHESIKFYCYRYCS